MLDTPILFLIFNRPDTTSVVFEKIRRQKPKKFYIGADGPRLNILDDKKKCENTRNIVLNGIDWPCETHTLFREENLGTGKAVSEAISWFFENEEQGIILEDDCLPDDTFFEFCSTLLYKYSNSEDVMSISGTNILLDGWKFKTQSYHFGHGGIWGWATWRRAWKLYDFNMNGWNKLQVQNKIKNAMKNENWYDYFYGMFEGTFNKKMDTWDLQWFFCILINGGKSISPSRNLVRNIGFGTGATNTTETNSPYANMITSPLSFPLIAPLIEEFDEDFLRKSFNYIFLYKKGFVGRVKFLFNNLLKKLQGH